MTQEQKDMSKTIIQTELIECTVTEEIQERINNFLVNNNIGASELIDIKMSRYSSSWSVLIIYKTNI